MSSKRTLWQILAVYVGASWVVLQVVDIVKDNMGLPDWVFPFALLLLLIGLPIIVATAMVQGRYAAAIASAQTAPVDSQQPAPPMPEPATHHKLFTWRNAVMGAGLAIVLLIVVTSGFMFMRNRGIGPVGSLVASGMLAEQAPIVLAQFESPDPSIGSAATEALRIDLSQSDVVALVDPASLTEALARMERSPDAKLTLEMAREVAVREGYAAVIAGEITAVGNGYVLTSRIVDAASGQTLASDRQSAANADEIIPAIDRLSAKMRERIGESYSDLRADDPLDQVTTGSLEALQKYSEAIEIFEAGGDESVGNALLEEAVELDPGFAMAWRKLGLTRTGGRARRIEAMERAFEARDRLTERERLHTEAIYYSQISRDYQASITAYERLIELDPNDDWALNNIGVVYDEDLGDYALAEQYYERANAADSSNVLSFRNAARTEINQGKLDEAETSLDRIFGMFPNDRTAAGLRVSLETNRGDYAAAQAAAERFDDLPSDPAVLMSKTGWLASIAATQGRLVEAEALAIESARHHEESGRSSPMLSMAQVLVWVDLNVRGDTVRAAARLAEYMESDGFHDSDPLSRDYSDVLVLLASTGSREDVESMIAEFESEVPDEYRQDMDDDYLDWEGTLLTREDRHAEAIALYTQRENRGCSLCRYMPLAHIFDAAGARDSAIAYYESYVNAFAAYRAFWDGNLLGPSLERLGQLYDETGDLDNAALYYARFVELWAEADDELQPRVQAAQARLDEILRERG
jgi:tetratricopeptide (TPR) repeat protein